VKRAVSSSVPRVLCAALLWSCLCVPPACLAQGAEPPSIFSSDIEPVFEHLTIDDGLPENSVRAILQDRWGFLWLGTQNGLVRYDGYDMRVFLPTPGDSTAFGGRTIEALYEDSDGYLWIGTFLNGLWRFDPRTETFTGFPLLPEGLNEGGRGRVTDICEDGSGRIWVALEQGLASLDRKTGQGQWYDPDFPEDVGPTDEGYSAVLADRWGRVWAGTEDRGIVVLDLEKGSMRFHTHDPQDEATLASRFVTDIYEDAAGTVWVTCNGGLSRWDPVADAFFSLVPAPVGDEVDNYLVCITHDERENLFWIGAAAGLYAFDPAASRFRLFAHDPSRPLSPVNGPVLSVICDRSGLVWAGSWLAGLNKMDPGGGWFRIRRHDPADPGSLDRDGVMAIHEDAADVLWVGTSSVPRGGGLGGLNRRERPDGPFRTLNMAPGGGREMPAVVGLHEDAGGTLWIGTVRGLWRVDGGSVVKVQAGQDPEAAVLSSATLRAVVSDARGNLWMGTHGGLFRWHRPTGRLVRYLRDPGDPHSISSNTITLFHVDGQGRVWASTDDRGLNLYRPETDDFRRYFDPERGLDTVMDIHETADGKFWLGSFAGLLLFDPEHGVETIYDRRHGLPNDQVVSLLPDGAGRLWLSTGKGFARFDPATEAFRTFDVRDGLPSNEVHFAHCRGRDGTLHFGGHHGLVSILPDLFQDNPVVPSVVLTDIAVQGASLPIGGDSPLAQPSHMTAALVLAHDRNDVAFTFTALDFGRPERNGYRYRLENYDARWRNQGGERTATYTNLDPGRYVFNVQGSNRDGVWNEAGVSLALTISPPWWETGWAYALYVLLAIALAYAIYRQVVQRERLRAAVAVEHAEALQYQELDRMKSRFLANITHEFRTPLTLIKAPLQRLQEGVTAEPGDLYATMARNAGRLGQLIDQLLDLSRLEAGRLPVKWRREDCLDFLRLHVASFQSLAEVRGIELVSDIPGEKCDAWCDRDLLDKLAGNLLSNALKFTPEGGRVEVAVAVGAETDEIRVPVARHREGETRSARARELRITVANTGSYIPPAECERIFDRFHQVERHAGSGIGLALVKEITEWLGGRIAVESDERTGTLFTATVPIFVTAPIDEYEADAAEPVETEDADNETADAATGETERPDEPAPLVLVVEDHPDLRTFLRNDLAPEFRVLDVPDGRAGLAMALAEIPDLVLSDVMMPEMNGFELCRRLKEDERTSHVPVILLTARTEAEQRHHGLRLGADDYLPKPFDAEDLKLRIRNLIDQRRKLAERYARKLAVLEPEAMPVTSADERFVLRGREIVDIHLDDPDFTVEAFCQEIAVSRTQLHRKLKAVINQSATEFIRTHRLQRAAQLLEGGYGNVTEVAYAVGFRNLSYFAKTFRVLYGVQPSDYPPRG